MTVSPVPGMWTVLYPERNKSEPSEGREWVKAPYCTARGSEIKPRHNGVLANLLPERQVDPQGLLINQASPA